MSPAGSLTFGDVHDLKPNLFTPCAENTFGLLCERLHGYKVPERRNLLIRGQFEYFGQMLCRSEQNSKISVIDASSNDVRLFLHANDAYTGRTCTL